MLLLLDDGPAAALDASRSSSADGESTSCCPTICSTRLDRLSAMAAATREGKSVVLLLPASWSWMCGVEGMQTAGDRR